MKAKAEETEQKEIDLLALLGGLWKARWRVALAGLAGLLLGLFYYMITPPTYEADALVQLEPKGGNLAVSTDLAGLMSGETQSTTEIEIIRSRMVLSEVVAEQNLEWRAAPRRLPVIGHALEKYPLPFKGSWLLRPFAQGGEAIRLELLTVPPEWDGEEMVLTRGEGDAFTLETPAGPLEGRVGEAIQDAARGFALRVGELRGAPGRQFVIAHLQGENVISGVRKRLSVGETGRNSGILAFTYQADTRDGAQRVLNSITQAYVRQNVDRSAAQAQSSLGFIEQQIPKARQDMMAAQERLNVYREAQGSIDISFETENLLTQIGTFETELRNLKAQEDEVADLYTPNHPKYRQLIAQRQRLQEQLDRLRGEIGTLPDTQREILNLTHDVEVAQQIYTELLTRAQEIDVMRASTVGNVRVVDIAETALRPVSPRGLRTLALGLILGLVAGAGWILVRDWMRKGVQSAADLERMGFTVFATINRSPEAEKLETSGKARGKIPLFALTHPTDLAIEGLRSLRTGLYFGMLDAPTRTVAITSTAPGAGKSFMAANFAVVTAQAGQKVCLIDADMRRGRLRHMFDVPRDTPGLANILAGEARLDDVLRETEVPGMLFLPPGKFPPNPAELLMRPVLGELMRELDERFDLSIFDCPPVLAVTDPVIIGKAVGANLLVVRFDQTPEGEIIAARNVMEASGASFKGAILNGYDHAAAKGGQAYSYRYEYKARD